MTSFPIMLNLAGRRSVVVGGGTVGLRKARSLLTAGAAVRLVTERRPGRAGSLAKAGVTVVVRPYRAELLRGALLVFACTDDRRLNARIAADARRARALVNVADQPQDCDFFMPATVRDGPVAIAIGTGGAAPALAAALASHLRKALSHRVGKFALLLERLRAHLKSAVPDPRRRMEIMKRLAGMATYRAFLQDGAKAVRARMNQLSER